MGGAENLPKRASSPLKRPASELDSEEPSSHRDDVDMITVASSVTTEPSKPMSPLSQRQRARSANMSEGQSQASTKVEPSPARSFSPSNEIPNIDTQIKTVQSLLEAFAQKDPKEGDKAYLVSRRWLERVTSRGTEAREHNKEEPEGEIGPIDNSDIIQQIITDHEGNDFVQLKNGVGSDQFELFDQDVWEMVFGWYGIMPGTQPIERYAHNTNPDIMGLPNMQFEFHPLVLKVHRLFSEHSPVPLPQQLKARDPPAPIVVASRSAKYVELLQKMKNATQIEVSAKIRVWRVPRQQPAAEAVAPAISMETPPTSRPGTPAATSVRLSVQSAPQDGWNKTLLDVVAFLKLQKGNGRELVDTPDHSANANYNGKMDITFVGIGGDDTLVLDEDVNGKDFVSTFNPKSTTSTALAKLGLPASLPTSGRSSPAPSGYNTRARATKNGRSRGSVGLSNLGNTCYMNSALQCVRSVEELTKYFLSGAADEEINTENPLGWGGAVAITYQSLLQEIDKPQVPTSVAPRQFKSTIGRFAPSFSGYGQQDSQEFLGFLLDGLQEDLSRVKKKPYIEKPDSTDDMVNNPAAIKEMADKVWDITKQRDDSVIADLFTGMYKSTVICPECDKISITFDPFNNVTLQLPIENTWSHEVTYLPLNDKPIKIMVDISKQGSFLALKEFVSLRVGVPTERLFCVEEFKNKFFKIHGNSSVASEEISTNDTCIVYELEAKPTNWPPRKVQKKNTYSLDEEHDIPSWEDPMAEKMLVPVFHRKPSDSTARFAKQWALVPLPHFIVLTPEEARSQDMIRRKILEKVATFSTHSDLHDDDDSRSNTSGSLIGTNVSDDSSGSAKVIADSVDGEEELVNVTKQSKDAVNPPAQSKYPTFNTQRPKFIDPKEFLNASIAGMFDIAYVRKGKELIPTGWSSVDDDKEYPSIATREPRKRDVATVVENESDSESRTRRSSESSEEDEVQYGGASTRMNEESDASEDEVLRPVVQRALPVRLAPHSHSAVRGKYNKRGNKNKKIKTYSKKNPQAYRKFNQTQVNSDDEMDTEPQDEGPLIRLGEAIVVDWKNEAFETVYCGDADDHLRGQNHFHHIPTMEDVQLKAKKSARAQRRKNGITLDECLAEFGKEEILSEQDMWYCPRCKEHRRASKKFELWKTPDVLIMHLKRFSSSGYRRDKLDVLVDFPMEGLDLSSKVIENEEGKTMIYDLFAVDDHWGGLGGGHYTAFAKNFFDDQWYEYNDSSVHKVPDLSRIVSSSAYLLFYRRRSDEPLGGPRLQEIVRNFEVQGSTDVSEEEAEEESGEGRGLVGVSSHHGSASPSFKGAGATLQRGGMGASKLKSTAKVSPASLEALPAYAAHETSADAAPMLTRDVLMNDGLQTSIEEDEGIGMDSPSERGFTLPEYTEKSSWGWSGIDEDSEIPSGLQALEQHQGGRQQRAASEAVADYASDIVDDQSSVSSSTRAGRMTEFDNADDGDYVDESYVPDMDDEAIASGVALQHDIFDSRLGQGPIQHVRVVNSDDGMDEDDEPAAEIHLDDNDVKLD